jgi:hypothetical protein
VSGSFGAVLRENWRPVRAALLVSLAAASIAGCGLGSHPGASTVTLTVTRDFGAHAVARSVKFKPSATETSLSLLNRQGQVARASDGAVQAIDGVTAAPGERWFQYVNGIQAEAQTTATAISAGDRVWWDLHASDAAGASPAVVGSFPEPFRDGIGGKRLPVTLECAADVRAACKQVESALSGAGIPVALQGLGTGSGSDTLGLVVGVWTDLNAQLDATLIAKGPGASGVYARFTGDSGKGLELLDQTGAVRRTLGAGAGLIAATRDVQNQPTWLITGTDEAGVLAAARALTVRHLHLHFALAADGGTYIPLPVR